jgi:hypothetical protein
LRRHMETMATLSNIPRKEKQFRNFTANSLNFGSGRQQTDKIVSEIWSFLSTLREKQKAAKQQRLDVNHENTAGAQEQRQEVQAAIIAPSSTEDTKQKERNDRAVTEPPKRETKSPVSVDTSGADDAGDDATLDSIRDAMVSILAQQTGGMPQKKLRKAVRRRLKFPKSDRERIKLLVKQVIRGRPRKEQSRQPIS